MHTQNKNDLIELAAPVINKLRINLPCDLNPSEFTLAALFILAGLRSKDDQWLQVNYRSQVSLPKKTDVKTAKASLTIQGMHQILLENFPETLIKNHFRFPFHLLKKASEQNSEYLISYCNYWRWRDVPSSAWQSLNNWHSGHFNLSLRFDIPSPQEVLEMQINGQRCVSVFNETSLLKQIHEHHRDAFLFTIHDLEHAWHFFSRPELFQFQRQWAWLLSKAFIQGPWKSFIDPLLMDRLNYLISDMNAHPWHAMLTLKNLWLQNWKLKLGLKAHQKLSAKDEQNFHFSWTELLCHWKMPDLERTSPSSQTVYFLACLEKIYVGTEMTTDHFLLSQ